jgi:DNA-binding transcriptional MerR regulator
MDKSPDAFRTISEVADFLETPAHVLRFWESRFPQIRPVKRAGGRRYYRPADVALLTGIKRLLHDEGLTIRGVQKILREQGVRHVAGLSGEVYHDDNDEDAEAALEEALTLNFGTPEDEAEIEPEQAASATVVALETALRRQDPAPEVSGVVQSLWPKAEPVTPAAASSDLIPDVDAPFVDAPSVDIPSVEETFAETPFVEAAFVEAEPYTEAPFIEAEEDTTPPEPVAFTESRKPAPEAPLLERLRALPALALAKAPESAALLHRLQALHQRQLAAPEQAAASR